MTDFRITRDEYPFIIEAVRWSDEDNGTSHFEPGVGYIVDDPDGLTVPGRWEEHLPVIEKALSGLDRTAPHPLDVDVIEYMSETKAVFDIYCSAAYCFVCGEHTPMTAMAESSPELKLANQFLTEYFEDWTVA